MGIRDAASKAFRQGASAIRHGQLPIGRTGRRAVHEGIPEDVLREGLIPPGIGGQAAERIGRGIGHVQRGASEFGQGVRANAPYAAVGAGGLAAPALMSDEGDDAAAQMTIETDPETGERSVKQVVNGEVVLHRESLWPPGKFDDFVRQLQARQEQALTNGVVGGIGALAGAGALALSPLGRKAGRGIRNAAGRFRGPPTAVEQAAKDFDHTPEGAAAIRAAINADIPVRKSSFPGGSRTQGVRA